LNGEYLYYIRDENATDSPPQSSIVILQFISVTSIESTQLLPSINVFISYSRKDENLREELDVHLSNLKRQGKIEAWHDRAIEAGVDWEAKTQEQLDTASIILLLVSPRFMASDYCYCIEMKQAMQRHEEGTARVIPIILKPVDWKNAPFSKLQALPKDGQPITSSSWNDLDTAFLDVVEGISLAVDSLNEEAIRQSYNIVTNNTIQSRSSDTEENSNSHTIPSLNMELSPKFKEFLGNTGIEFSNGNREHISLDDLFVFPDLKSKSETSKEDTSIYISGDKIWNYDKRILIFGDEQSGKTTFAKILFLKNYQAGYLPLFLDGSKINTSNIDEIIQKQIGEIYGYEFIDKFLQQDNKICIVDDMSACKLNPKAKRKLIENLNSYFQRTIFFAEESFKFVLSDFPQFCEYIELDILLLGNTRRSELIEKWVGLEVTEETEEQKIFKKIDELRLHIDSLVRKNIVPAKPFYILLLLQAFDATNSQRIDLTSHGHCYQYLIYQSLDRVRVKQNEIEDYFNVLSEFAGEILEASSESLDESSLDEFFKRYSENFLPIDDRKKVIEDLVKSSILTYAENRLRFRYRYLFYFFAAKKLADSLHRGEVAKDRIRKLVDTLHLEKSSNIVLFLTHHSKDTWILDEILYSIMELFSNEEEATLKAGSLSFLQDFVKEIPELILEKREARQERLECDRRKDIIDRHEKHIIDDEKIERDPAAFMAKVNKVFRGIEVCGQILRNRLGSLERTFLESIVEESFSVSLRFLSLFLKLSDYVREETIREIKNIIDEYPSRSDLKVTQKAESFYFALNYTVIFAMLQKTSFSLGSAKGRDIYKKVAENKGTPASWLIQQIIELQFEKNINFGRIEELHTEFSKNSLNPVCDRLLKEIILRHCYMHDIGYRDRQKISAMLNISMHQQQLNKIATKRIR
jgi:TIR domain